MAPGDLPGWVADTTGRIAVRLGILQRNSYLASRLVREGILEFLRNGLEHCQISQNGIRMSSKDAATNRNRRPDSKFGMTGECENGRPTGAVCHHFFQKRQNDSVFRHRGRQ